MTPDSYLALTGIAKSFGAFTALANIDLHIHKGEFVCFLGPSGCGKTTLLRIIAGLETQNAGRILQGGRDISLASPMERDYGIVFQSYALFPNLSIANNVGYGLVNRGQDKAAIAARVRELLDLVGLSSSGAKYPAQLSGGQQQRIALARALATQPGLLLLDEPLSALDALERVRLRSEIRSLQQRLGVTTIMVTHDQEEALSMADRIVVMDHGKICQIGTPQQVYLEPQSLFVASFVGKVNVLNGMVAGAGRFRAGTLEFSADLPLGQQAVGHPVKICLRPEEWVLDQAAAPQHKIGGVVQKIEFLGPLCFVTWELDGLPQQPVLMSVALQQMQQLGLQPGLRSQLAVLPQRVRVFDGASA